MIRELILLSFLCREDEEDEKMTHAWAHWAHWAHHIHNVLYRKCIYYEKTIHTDSYRE